MRVFLWVYSRIMACQYLELLLLLLKMMMMMMILEVVRGAESSIIIVGRELKQVNNDVLKQLKLMTEDVQVQTGNSCIRSHLVFSR